MCNVDYITAPEFVRNYVENNGYDFEFCSFESDKDIHTSQIEITSKDREKYIISIKKANENY